MEETKQPHTFSVDEIHTESIEEDVEEKENIQEKSKESKIKEFKEEIKEIQINKGLMNKIEEDKTKDINLINSCTILILKDLNILLFSINYLFKLSKWSKEIDESFHSDKEFSINISKEESK